MKKPTIYLDMDGTIADLYRVPDWLSKLQAHKASPYRQATPMLNMRVLSRILNALIKEGYNISIISWLSKDNSADYAQKVIKAKKSWLKKHLNSVNFNELIFVPYGTNKASLVRAPCILFDDDARNRREWRKKYGNCAYDQTQIIETLKNILTEAQ